MDWLTALARIANGVMDALNRSKKKKYADNSDGTIANGGRVQHSSKTFSDLADEPERNKTK